MSEIPEKVYKYRALSGNSFEYTMDMLQNNHIYMPTVKELNDPFEGTHKYNFNGYKFKFDDGKTYTIGNGTSYVVKTSYKVFSLSELPDITTMWVHYADDFKGVCIEFSTSKTFSKIEKVEYSAIPITNSDLKGNFLGTEYRKALLRKDKVWEHEKEWRLITYANKFIELEENEIKTVILGNKISLEHEQLIIDWAYKNKVDVKRCGFSKNSYEVRIY